MIELRVMREDDINEVSNFISELNTLESSHIGYCGKSSKDIYQALKEDICDIEYTQSFITAYEHEKLIGVLGFDADIENNSAEIWGPFIKADKWAIATDLWKEMIKVIPPNIRTLCMFPNKQNTHVLDLAEDLAFNKHSEHAILTFSNKCLDVSESAMELSQEYFDDFADLHDTVFSNTYYTGKQIIEMLNEHRKVFIIEENSSLSGYIYVEAEPDVGLGNIEFLAVSEFQRHKGIARRLLSTALKWLFDFDTINDITLCVNLQNDNAIKLYTNFGFIHSHDLSFFTKNL